MNLETTQRQHCGAGEKIRKDRKWDEMSLACWQLSGCQEQRLIVGWRLEVARFIFQLIRTYVSQPKRKQ